MHPIVSIILLNYNWLKFNKLCINSILQQSYKAFEIVFVDNVSTDGSLEEVKKIYQKEIQSKKIVIVENTKNTWFAWGNNLWVQYTDKKSEYICLLNNDTTVPKDRLEELVKGIKSDPKLWAVWSIILDKWYEGVIKRHILEEKNIYTSSIFWENILQHFSEKENQNNLAYSSVLSWCSLMYKKNILWNPFPEYYFAYAEDVYLSRYILKSWHKLAYCLTSFVNHYGSGSFGKTISPLKLFHGNKNQIINFLIFYSIKDIILLFPLFILREISHLFLLWWWKRFTAKIKAWIWICKNRKQIKASKKIIQSATKITQKQFIENLSGKLSDPNVFYYHFNRFQKKIIQWVNKVFIWYIWLIGKFL